MSENKRNVKDKDNDNTTVRSGSAVGVKTAHAENNIRPIAKDKDNDNIAVSTCTPGGDPKKGFGIDAWGQELELEISKYVGQEDGSAYKPGPLNNRQLRNAAIEFQKRWEKEESRFEEEGEESLETVECPFLLVSRNCSEMPSDGMTHRALQGLEMTKLWYYLSDDGDLFITKLACGPCHSNTVGAIIFNLETFADRYVNGNEDPFSAGGDGKYTVAGGTRAPDAALQRVYPLPLAAGPMVLRSPFVVELEVGHRGPKALMLQLEQYVQLPYSAFVLGIKIYKKSQTVPGQPFPAVALLWHQPPVPAGGGPPPNIVLVGVWNFGTADLHINSKKAFCVPPPPFPPLPGCYTGMLPRPALNNFPGLAPPPVIQVPAVDLVTNQRVLYSNNTLVPVEAGNHNLTIDLAKVLRKASNFNI